MTMWHELKVMNAVPPFLIIPLVASTGKFLTSTDTTATESLLSVRESQKRQLTLDETSAALPFPLIPYLAEFSHSSKQ